MKWSDRCVIDAYMGSNIFPHTYLYPILQGSIETCGKYLDMQSSSLFVNAINTEVTFDTFRKDFAISPVYFH